jgi:hypothetical protein
MASFDQLQWVGIRLATGAVITDLPGIELTSDLAVTIGQPETASLNLHVTKDVSTSWLDMTQVGGAGLIAWIGDPQSPTIVWGGIVQQRFRPVGANIVALGLSTVEAYLDGCQIGTYNAVNVNQDAILASLMSFANGTNQLPWVLNHLPNASTQTQSASYTPSSETSVLASLQALSAYNGGPEWYASWQWNLAAGTIVPVLNYGQRVGAAALNGLPAVTFESTDMLLGSGLNEDYSAGQGANQIIANGAANQSAANSIVPSAVANFPLNGRPQWTLVYRPNQTVSDTAVLAQYVAAAGAGIQNGAQPLTVVLPYKLPGKQLARDWNLGDDVGYALTGDAFPDTPSGVRRCIGYKANLSTITPILKAS